MADIYSIFKICAPRAMRRAANQQTITPPESPGRQSELLLVRQWPERPELFLRRCTLLFNKNFSFSAKNGRF